MNEAAKRIKQNLIDFSELGIWIAMGLLIGAITAFLSSSIRWDLKLC